MTNRRWHMIHEGSAVTVARRVPVRFDLGVTTRLSGGSRSKVARQVRQDMWRALQNLRGFSPAVRVENDAGGLKITAGGQVDGKFPRVWAEEQIAAVLENPLNRARWMRWAS